MSDIDPLMELLPDFGFTLCLSFKCCMWRSGQKGFRSCLREICLNLLRNNPYQRGAEIKMNVYPRTLAESNLELRIFFYFIFLLFLKCHFNSLVCKFLGNQTDIGVAKNKILKITNFIFCKAAMCVVKSAIQTSLT